MRAVGNAEDCNVRCEASPITECRPDDKCCPAGCSTMSDNDCLTSCGNGKLDPGETCERTDDTNPCPTSCDDNDPCTVDDSTGSAANCNIVCNHTAIKQAKAGDGCCPMGATANNDSDCQARCGNAVIEPGESCEDGNQVAGDGCHNCKMETPAQICMVRVNATTACGECSCNKCTTQLMACQGATDVAAAKTCTDMVDCARKANCGDPDCLCGTTDSFTCGLDPTTAKGPCAQQVFAAAETTDPLTASLRASNTRYALGRANLVGTCVRANCASECGL
jgi:cysteine-rich repeat protein